MMYTNCIVKANDKYYITDEYSDDELNILKDHVPDIDQFNCDTLMTPIIATLLNKGYITEYCCQGHYYPNIIGINLDEKTDSFFFTVKGSRVSFPYISFKGEYKFKDLPNGWYVKYEPSSLDIKMDLYTKDIDEFDTIEECKKYCNEINTVIRHDYGKDYDKFVDSEDSMLMTYEFNRILLSMYEELYKWAANLLSLR